MNCKEKGPVWICLNFDTFVCTTCSGIHREFSHRIKSISMATFTPEEIKRLQESGGNECARKIYLAKWSSSEFPIPEAGDKSRIREFIKLCYKDKKWYQEGPSNNNSSKVNLTVSDSDENQNVRPIKEIVSNPPPLVVQKKKFGRRFIR